MAQAIRLAGRGVGHTGENPSVGCVLVKGGVVIGTGRTANGGRPHAETAAIAGAVSDTSGATAYVTLEPCAHHGKTPPCCEALLAAGIARVVIAVTDPDDRVAGQGIAFLTSNGVDVVTGVMETEAQEALTGYLARKQSGRPRVIAKSAISIDGKIALANGKSQWITGAEARAHGHLLRSRVDAIVVGSGTVLADIPSLTCRLSGLEDTGPTRVLFDRRGDVPAHHDFFRDAQARPLIAFSPDQALESVEGVTRIPPADGLDESLIALGKVGISRLLVEGGAGVLARFVKEALIDEWFVYGAAKTLGGDAMSVIGPLGLSSLPDHAPYCVKTFRRVGHDWLVRLVKKG